MKRLIGSLVILFCALSTVPALAAAADDAAKACAGGDPIPDKRIAACGKVLATNPKQDAKIAWVFKARGNAYFSKGDLDKAVKDYDIAIRLDPRDSTALANRGTMQMSQGKGALALADYNAALKVNPKDTNVYSLRGFLYSRTGHLDLAIQDYTTALKLDPKFADAHSGRGYAYYITKKYDLALADFDAAVKLVPQDPLSVYMRSLTYRKLGKKAQADKDLATARKLDPKIEEELKSIGVAD
jgi:tetratricopeptide (TPR) repeat protein